MGIPSRMAMFIIISCSEQFSWHIFFGILKNASCFLKKKRPSVRESIYPKICVIKPNTKDLYLFSLKLYFIAVQCGGYTASSCEECLNIRTGQCGGDCEPNVNPYRCEKKFVAQPNARYGSSVQVGKPIQAPNANKCGDFCRASLCARGFTAACDDYDY